MVIVINNVINSAINTLLYTGNVYTAGLERNHVIFLSFPHVNTTYTVFNIKLL